MIVAAVIAVVGAPLLRHGAAGEESRRAELLSELEARKEAKYREIRDAQSDLAAGKLSEEDHRALDRGLRREAIEILQEIDRVSTRPAQPPEGGTGGSG